MAFPATVPSNGTRRTEDGVDFIVRNGRWEKLIAPAGVSGGVFAGKTWTEINWTGIQDRPRSMIQIYAAMTPAADANIDVGFWSAGGGAFLPSSSYVPSKAAGLVDWGDGGQERLNWSSPNAFNHNGFWLANFDNSTRFSAANRPQILAMKLLKAGASVTMISWEFYQQVNYAGNATTVNTCKMAVNKPLNDLTRMFFRVDGTKTFASGHATVEVY